MNRRLQYFNFVGVLGLTVLCAVQWQTNRQLNLEVTRLDQIRQQQAVQLEEQAKSLKELSADLDRFRTQLVVANSTATESGVRASSQEAQLRQLTGERDQLKVSVTNWATAVTKRDEQLKIAAEQLQKLGTQRQELTEKYNQLAEKFNGVVKDLNEARQQLGAARANTPAPPPKP